VPKILILTVIKMNPQSRLVSIRIQGYRPFRDFRATFGSLEVFVGANGSGKSSLFEFLKFLRDSVYQDIPSEIIAGAIGQEIFHFPGPQKFQWHAEFISGSPTNLIYEGKILGPIGRAQVTFERVQAQPPAGNLHMDVNARQGLVQDWADKKNLTHEIALKRHNQLALSTMTNPALMTLYNLREHIQAWRFYSSFNFANHKLRKSVPFEQEPVLHEDAGNLSSLLHYLMTEHRPIFDELQQHLRSVVPGFRGLTVKARGGPGDVIAFWQEEGVDRELSLADLSDGILRLICWMALCLQPNPPSLICIAEPDQGVHPRTLPALAGLFEKACRRTQVFLATHASYFLMQFDLARIALVIALPDLYPKNIGFQHQTVDELVHGINKNFAAALHGKGVQDDARLTDRFKVFCLKYDLEALILAAREPLKQRLGLATLEPSWRVPVEEQNHDRPPKKIVEELFKKCHQRYQGTVDAPLILAMASYQEIANACQQYFKPFVDFLAQVSIIA